MSHKQPLSCGESHCELPFAYVQNGALVIESRHHGERHVNVLALAQVVELLQAAPQTFAGMPVETADWLPDDVPCYLRPAMK